MQMFSDGSPAEFTPIGEWVREHSVFNMMKQLRFFRTFMALRMLRTWRAAARARHFDRVGAGCSRGEGRRKGECRYAAQAAEEGGGTHTAPPKGDLGLHSPSFTCPTNPSEGCCFFVSLDRKSVV